MIFQFTRPDQLSRWLRANAPTVVSNNPTLGGKDLWRAYLRSLSVTGGTWHDLENAYLTQQGTVANHKLRQRYSIFANSSKQSGIAQQLREKYAA